MNMIESLRKATYILIFASLVKSLDIFLLADNFVEIGSSGRMFGKEECLADGVSPDEMTIHDFASASFYRRGLYVTTYQIMNKTNNGREEPYAAPFGSRLTDAGNSILIRAR